MRADELNSLIYGETDELNWNPDVVCISEDGRQFEIDKVDLTAMPGVLMLKIIEVKSE